MLTAIIIGLIVWFVEIPLALQIVATVAMAIKFVIDTFAFLYKISEK